MQLILLVRFVIIARCLVPIAALLCCLEAGPSQMLILAPSFAQDGPIVPQQAQQSARPKAPLEGRVEVLRQQSEPSLPDYLLNGGVRQIETLPIELTGKWYGTIHVAQMQTFPGGHSNDPYWNEFIAQITSFVKPNQRGEVTLHFKTDPSGTLQLSSSDVILRGGTRLQLTSGKGPALVRGGFNWPETMANRVTLLPNSIAEQTRLDRVAILNDRGQLIKQGYTEISASYELKSPRSILVKLIEIDYDEMRHPLWKVVLEGQARR